MTPDTHLMQPTAEIRPADTLADLKVDINRYHNECEVAAGKAIDLARRAGELLIKVKEQLRHGASLPWLQEHFKGSERTAQTYMRVARNWPKLKSATAADLSLRDAIAALTDEKPKDHLPALVEGVAYLAEEPDGTIHEAMQSAKYPGYWYFARYDATGVTYGRRPIRVTDATRQSITRGHMIPADLDWIEFQFDQKEPWYITTPLPDGSDPANPWRKFQPQKAST